MRTEERNAEWRGWLVLALLFVVAILNYLDRTMIATMRESIMFSITMTEAQFGLLTTVFSWVYGGFCPIAGFIADRVNKKYLIIGSLFVWSSVNLMTGYVSTYNELLATRALIGISKAFFYPSVLSLIMDNYRKPSLAIGILFCGDTVGQSLGFLGGDIAENHSWNAAFHIFGWVGVVYAVFLIFILKTRLTSSMIFVGEKKEKQQTSKNRFGTTLGALFGNRSFFYLLLLYPLASIVSWMVMTWLPTYYQEMFQITQSEAGKYGTVFFYPASILGLLLGGYLTDKWQKTYPYARMLMPVIGFGVAAPCVFMIGYTHILWQAVTLFLIFGFARMFIDNTLMPILCMVIDKRYRATAYGIINMASVFIGGMSSYIAGVFRDADVSLSTVFQYASIGLALCMVILLLIKHEVKKNNALPS